MPSLDLVCIHYVDRPAPLKDRKKGEGQVGRARGAGFLFWPASRPPWCGTYSDTRRRATAATFPSKKAIKG